MSPVVWKFLLTSCLVAGAMGGGYAARRLGAKDVVAEWCMWFVMVLGYSTVGLVAVWHMDMRQVNLWLPVYGGVFVIACTFASLAAGRLLTADRRQMGLIGLCGGMGNAGFTMGAFLCYVFFGPDGLGLAAIYCLMWNPMVPLLAYPIARHYTAETAKPAGLARLMWRSMWDIRSIGLPMMIAGMALSYARVGVPAVVDEAHFTDIMMGATAVAGFFAAGLRLRVGSIRPLLRPMLGVAALRFVLAPLIGVAIWQLTRLTPWPLEGVTRNVFLVESCLPVAITVVAIANLFKLAPDQASALFVVNTLAYLAICVPALAWVFG